MCATLHSNSMAVAEHSDTSPQMLRLTMSCRAGTIALAGELGGLQISNTGTGTIYTSGVSSAAAAAVSGSGRTIVLPASGEHVPCVCLSFMTHLYSNLHQPHLPIPGCTCICIPCFAGTAVSTVPGGAGTINIVNGQCTVAVSACACRLLSS